MQNSNVNSVALPYHHWASRNSGSSSRGSSCNSGVSSQSSSHNSDISLHLPSFHHHPECSPYPQSRQSLQCSSSLPRLQLIKEEDSFSILMHLYWREQDFISLKEGDDHADLALEAVTEAKRKLTWMSGACISSIEKTVSVTNWGGITSNSEKTQAVCWEVLQCPEEDKVKVQGMRSEYDQGFCLKDKSERFYKNRD
ncbi:hypothetical protein BDR07DRAFT_1487243 [Suillus spraguei]|nr:hypothetical protein BDR07DRAFT_1487243 [Suillus spraguei]